MCNSPLFPFRFYFQLFKCNLFIFWLRYNLRSRPSDLIKFDSPVRQSLAPAPLSTNHHHQSRKSMLPTILLPPTLEEDSNTTIRHDPFASPYKQHEEIDENKENNETEVVDFFGEEDTLGRPNLDVINLKLRTSIAPTSTNAYTPQRRISVMRESLEPDRIINLSRSPLLKLALISSHSKRLSTSQRPAVDLTPTFY